MDISISKQNKLLFFSKYIGTSCLIYDMEDKSPKTAMIEGIDWVNQSVISERINVDPDIIVLILDKIENVSDFDCLMLASINLESITNISEQQLITHSRRNLYSYVCNHNIGGFTKLVESLNYLQIKGYCVPYTYFQSDIVTTLSVKQIIELGLVTFK